MNSGSVVFAMPCVLNASRRLKMNTSSSGQRCEIEDTTNGSRTRPIEETPRSGQRQSSTPDRPTPAESSILEGDFAPTPPGRDRGGMRAALLKVERARPSTHAYRSVFLTAQGRTGATSTPRRPIP